MTSEPLPKALTGTRTTRFRYELLDQDENLLGEIDGVTGGSLQWSAATSVKASGSIDVIDVDNIDWMSARIKIWRIIGDDEQPRGIYIPSSPKPRWVQGAWQWSIELLGKLTLLAQDELPTWGTIPVGTVITTKVRDLLTAAGHTRLQIRDSAATLRTAINWEAGATRLSIINDLLDAAGYWSLTVDSDGTFVAEPYTRPADRPTRYDLKDDEDGIYKDDFTRDLDLYSIPNRVIIISQSSEEVPPLIGLAEITDPTNPLSISARGRVIAYQESGVEAATQAVVDELAQRRLLEKAAVTETIPIEHAPIPLDLNDAIHFRRVPAGIDGKFTVQAMTEPLNEAGLMQTTLRKVTT